eukprot:3482891-Prymnesium_polylepis.1
MGVAAVYESLPSLMAGAEVIHFIDNQSALYGMAKGSSRPSPTSQALISSLHVRQILGLTSGSRTSRPRPTSPTCRRVVPTPRWPRSCAPSTQRSPSMAPPCRSSLVPDITAATGWRAPPLSRRPPAAAFQARCAAAARRRRLSRCCCAAAGRGGPGSFGISQPYERAPIVSPARC